MALGDYSPPMEHARPPSDGENYLFGDFWQLTYSENHVGIVSALSENSWRHPWTRSTSLSFNFKGIGWREAALHASYEGHRWSPLTYTRRVCDLFDSGRQTYTTRHDSGSSMTPDIILNQMPACLFYGFFHMQSRFHASCNNR